jgi:hypothetical protein
MKVIVLDSIFLQITLIICQTFIKPIDPGTIDKLSFLASFRLVALVHTPLVTGALSNDISLVTGAMSNNTPILLTGAAGSVGSVGRVIIKLLRVIV